MTRSSRKHAARASSRAANWSPARSKNEGVDTIFTLCGGHIIDIYDGCVDEGIRIVDVRYEQVAAHAADGYARQTGKLGCVVTTAGPGCTNAVTGVARAFRSESPIIHIGGQGALSQHKMGSLQDLPHVDIMGPITKFAATIPSTEHSVDGRARNLQRRARPGVSGDSARRARSRSRRDQSGDSATRPVSRLDEVDRRSEHPAIMFGQQVWTARGHEEAIALLRGLDVPGYFNGASRGLLPPGDPHHFDRTRSQAFAKADLIVIVGTLFDFRMGYGKRISRDLKLVQINMDYRTVGKNCDIDLGLVGDPGAILGAGLQASAGRLEDDKRQARQTWIRELAVAEETATAKLMPLFTSDASPIHPYRVAHEINQFCRTTPSISVTAATS